VANCRPWTFAHSEITQMGRLELGDYEHIEAHVNTDTEYYNPVSDEVLKSRLRHIADILTSNPGNHCYVVGMGAQSKSTYQALDDVDGIHVVWSGSMLPRFARVLGLVIASHAGVLKIEDPRVLPKVMLRLAQRSMAGVYVFSHASELRFVERVTAEPVVQGIVFDIKSDPDYFFYVVDADNFESETGMVEIVSYGKGATLFKQLF